MDLEAFMRTLVCRHNRRIADQRIMDTWVWHQVRLELVEIDIERTIEAQAGGDGADDLCNQPIEMLIVWSWDVKVASADVVHGLVVDKECAVGVLDRAVSGQDRIVWLDDRC